MSIISATVTQAQNIKTHTTSATFCDLNLHPIIHHLLWQPTPWTQGPCLQWRTFVKPSDHTVQLLTRTAGHGVWLMMNEHKEWTLPACSI